MFDLVASSISGKDLESALFNESAGALVTFEGRVRNHNEGKQVSSLEYQVYETLARTEGKKIIDEAQAKFSIHAASCVHRFGHLALGETAVWIGATASHRDDAFRATRYIIDQIKLRLPIWKKEHYVTADANWVFCRDHHTHVHFNESDFYAKQTKLALQDVLKNAKIAIIGVGGLGCPAATALCMAGVGTINLHDPDRVSLSNLHRQPLYSADQVGEKKVEIAAAKLRAINPFITIIAHENYVSPANARSLLDGVDLVLDCTDNLQSKLSVHDACFKLRIPLVSASVYQFEGTLRTFVPGKSGCLRCLESSAIDEVIGNCNDFGVLGSVVNSLGNIQATEALLYLQSKQNNSIAETLFFNFKTLSQFRVRNVKTDACLSCDGKFEPQSYDLEIDSSALNEMNASLVDIRNKELKGLLEEFDFSKPTVLYCDRGVRSKKVVQELRSHGFDQVYSLKGGACSL
jgi:molybdopterin/thiamine biosynthesis adenylyltransferase/molybdopterin synthase catalytic subunit